MHTKIIDERTEFKITSFSNYKINQLKKDLNNAILNGNLEKSNFFICELICSGHFLTIWDIILNILGKNIYDCNIKLICYLHIKYEEFKKYMNSIEQEINIRNSLFIRELYCEIMSIIVLSNKVQTINRVIVKSEDLESTKLGFKLKADNIEYVSTVFSTDDPKELYIATNELIYNLNCENPNKLIIFFWIEWILKFTQKLKSNNTKLVCLSRGYPVLDKHKKNVIFLIWDCIKTKKTDNKLINRSIESLINLFCIRYSPSYNNKRVYLLYLSVQLLISNNININIPIVNDFVVIQNIIKKNDYFYKKIKKNEVNLHIEGNAIEDNENIDNKKSKIDYILTTT